MLQKLSRYSFFAFLLIVPFQTVWLWREVFVDGEKWQYGMIGLYGTDVFLLLAIASSCLTIFFKGTKCFFQSRTKTNEHFHRSFRDSVPKPFVFLVALGIVAMSSYVWAEDQTLVIYTMFKLLLAMGVFWLARTNDTFRVERDTLSRWFLVGVVIVAVLESVLGVSQFLTQSPVVASKWLGMSDYQSWQPGVSVLKNESGRWLRAYGTFPHPNIFGAYAGVMLVGMVSWFVLFGVTPHFLPERLRSFSRAGMRSLGRIQEKIQTRIPGQARDDTGSSLSFCKFFFFILILNTLFLGLIVSFSRTAWLGIGLALGVLALVVWQRGNAVQKHNLVKVFSVLIFSGIIFTSILHETVFPRFESATLAREGSVVDRVVLLQQAGEIIRQYIWLGVGAGNYTLAVRRNHPEIPIWDVQPVHNVFVLVTAELGVIGGLLFTFFFVFILFQMFRHMFVSDFQKEKMIASIAFFTLIPSLFLDHFLWDSHFGLLLFFVLVGLVMQKAEKKINT